MRPPNEAIFRAIMDWGSEKWNAVKIREAHLSRGGWENWAQVELMDLFHAGREENCFLDFPERRADLVLTAQSQNVFEAPYVETGSVIIELKCESYFNAPKFKEGVQEDLEKVGNSRIKDRLTLHGCNIYCVGLSMSHEGAVDMEDLGLEEFEMPRDLGNKTPPFRLWWKVRQLSPSWV
jgi:hypothetical protein